MCYIQEWVLSRSATLTRFGYTEGPVYHGYKRLALEQLGIRGFRISGSQMTPLRTRPTSQHNQRYCVSTQVTSWPYIQHDDLSVLITH